MIRVFRSEWVKLRRPTLLLGTVGAMAAFAALSTFGRFRIAAVALAAARRRELAEARGEPVPGGGDGPDAAEIVAQLAAPDGWLLGFASVGRLIGFVSLVVFALAIGHEYRYGTLRAALAIEPRRVRLLAGKLLAVASLVTAAMVTAVVTSLAVAFAMAGSVGVDTGAWLGSFAETGAVFANVWLSAMAWGMAGLALAVAFRSNAPAIGVGVIYGAVGEPVLGLVANSLELDTLTRWLPAQLLSTLASGGGDVAYAAALVAGMVYTVGLWAASTLLLVRRDVTV